MRVDRLFILIGIAYLFVGMTLGWHMGSSGDVTQRPTHAHINLLGFASMSIFGLIYHVWPKMQESILAKIHFGIHQIATFILLVTLYLVLGEQVSGEAAGPIFNILEIALIIGVALFGWNAFQSTTE